MLEMKWIMLLWQLWYKPYSTVIGILSNKFKVIDNLPMNSKWAKYKKFIFFKYSIDVHKNYHEWSKATPELNEESHEVLVQLDFLSFLIVKNWCDYAKWRLVKIFNGVLCIYLCE